MRIKKLLIGVLVSSLIFSFIGCGDKTINDKGEEVYSFGQFIEIKSYEFTTGYSKYIQHFVYDKDTKIIYILYEKSYGVATSLYYVLDENGKPEIAIYGENYKG